jgi:two-component system invasion response regulator UvrY
VSRTLRVLVADDQAPFRKAARAVLEIAPEFEVVGEVTSGEEAVDEAELLRPDLVVMDVKMNGIGGVEATRRILAARPETLVVLVSSYRSEDVPQAVAESGALAFVPKDRFSAATLASLLADQG